MKNFIPIFVMVFVLISCEDGQVRNKAVSTQTFDGGIDTGGSNDYMGKPMESYIIDVTTLPEYETEVLPVLKNLDEKLPRFSKILKSSINNRSWYLLPGELKTLPNHNIAVPSNVNTDQFALHSEKSVWLSADKRESYDSEIDRATHILHEMVMAVKVDGNLKRRKIENKPIVTNNEYDEIRSLTRLLMSKDFSAEELDLTLRKNNFYNSGDTLDLVKLHPFDLLPAGSMEFENTEDFFAYVDNVRYSKSYKRYGLEEPVRAQVEDFCSYEITKTSVKVKVFDKGGKATSNKTVTFSEKVDYSIKDQSVSEKYISKKKTNGDVSEAQMAHLYYLKDELLYIEIYNVYKDQFIKEWTANSIPSTYTMCINRSLQ